jgi:hypothetical protein
VRCQVSLGNVRDDEGRAMSAKVEFAQPMVEPPENGTWCYYAGVTAVRIKWGGADDWKALWAGKIYATADECAQRIAYDAQQMARMVIPAWFRAMGPGVEVKRGDGWAHFPAEEIHRWIGDWSKEKPENYRAKPRDVVVTVNGREFRWPATVTAGEPIGPRHIVISNDVVSWDQHTKYGPRVHHTRAGAESQLAAIRAAAGESL